MMFVIYFFVCIFCITVNAAQCPSGSLPTPTNEGVCYFFGTGNVYYLEAEEICHQNGGHLASIHNMMDDMFMAQEAIKAFQHSTNGDFWFGLSNIVEDSFSWIDSTPFDFINWAEGQEPEGNETDAFCGAVIQETGQWHVKYCFDQKPFVCAIPAISETPVPTTTLAPIIPKSCPSNWEYYPGTEFCYKVFPNANWYDAENRCRQNGAHLASIHSREEAFYVGNLAYIPGAEACDASKQAWIGLYSNDNISWQWTDGTPFDYDKWGNTQPDLPGLQKCVEIFAASNQCNWNVGDFDNLQCRSQLSSYICKKAPS